MTTSRLSPAPPVLAAAPIMLIPRLTPRQVQVLQMLAGGMTTRQVALRIGISPSTVNVYVKRAADRLGAIGRTHAVALAIAFGLITPSTDGVVPAVNRLTTR